MSRFIMVAAMVGAPPGGQLNRWGRGTTVADTSGNAVAGDLVWASLCVAPSPFNLAPLDAAGVALMPGSTQTTLANLAANPGAGAGIAGILGPGIGQT